MKRRIGLLIVCLAVPASLWGGSIFGPTGASASGSVEDWLYGDQFATCSVGPIPIAKCTASGTSPGGGIPPGDGTITSMADPTTGLLSVSGTSALDGGVGGSASIQDTLYFHNFSDDGAYGTMTLTASGSAVQTVEGAATLILTERFEDPDVTTVPGFQWVFSEHAYYQYNFAPGCVTYAYGPYITACQSAVGNNLMVSLTFPLDSNGLYFDAELDGSSVGYVVFTDPMTVSLPTGTTFTSDSGLFLSALGTPEPGTWGLMMAALALGLGMRRQHRRKG